MNAFLGEPQYSQGATPQDGGFAFHGPGGTVRSKGALGPVPRGTADTLAARIHGAFRQSGPNAVIGGALPFRRSDQDYLWCADDVTGRVPTQDRAPSAGRTCQLQAEPTAARYADSVASALELMRREAGLPDGLRKVVLARTLNIRTQDPIVADDLLARLADDDTITAFRVTLPPAASQTTTRHLIGATPELLLEKRGRTILSNPLAGSARRSRQTIEDADACAALARSEKDHHEHAMVVEYILDILAPYCSRLDRPEGTRLTSTRSMWHLGTRIRGELRDDDIPSAVLAARLHPTPAICGLPCQRAADLIDQLEPVGRDFYAGAVGWCDRRGDGAWYVAIRCADICGREARLYAGAGVVVGSDPEAEAAETGSKFSAMLQALGLPVDAALQD